MGPSHHNSTSSRWWCTIVASSLCTLLLLVVRPSSLQQQLETATTALLVSSSTTSSRREQPQRSAVHTPAVANTTTSTTLYLPLYTQQGLCLHRRQQSNSSITTGPCNDDTALLRFAFDAVLTENLYQLRTMQEGGVALCLDATQTMALQLTPCTTIRTLEQADTSSQLWSVLRVNNNTTSNPYYLQSVGHRRQCVAAAKSAEVGLADCHQTTSSTNTASLRVLTLPHPSSSTYGPAPIERGREHCLDDDNLHWVECRSSSSSEWQALVFDHHSTSLLFSDQHDGDDDHDTVYQFRSIRTGLCLGLTANDVNVVPCDTSHPSTFWRVQNDMVKSQADPSLCWDTMTELSTLLQVAPCSNAKTTSSMTMVVRALQQQGFEIGPTSIVRFDGTCLQTTSDGRLAEEDCTETEAQQFRLRPTSTNNEFLIQSVTTEACLVRNDDTVAINGPCDAGNANAVWTLTVDVQNGGTASTTIANNNQCITSPWIFRQSGFLGLLLGILNFFLDFFRNLFGRDRRVQLGSCTEAAAQNTLSLPLVQRDPWQGPIQTALVASAMANRPDGAYTMICVVMND